MLGISADIKKHVNRSVSHTCVSIDAELGTIPTEVYVVMTSTRDAAEDCNSEDEVSYHTGSQMPPGIEELKRKYDDMERKLETANELAASLLLKEKKRNIRGPKKNLERGDSFVPLKKIAEDNRLSNDKMYSVCKLVRTKLFSNMKYFSEYYKDRSLELSYKELCISTDEEKKARYRDFIICYIEGKTTSQRNNCIYALKRCMLGEDEQGGTYKHFCYAPVSSSELSNSNL